MELLSDIKQQNFQTDKQFLHSKSVSAHRKSNSTPANMFCWICFPRSECSSLIKHGQALTTHYLPQISSQGVPHYFFSHSHCKYKDESTRVVNALSRISFCSQWLLSIVYCRLLRASLSSQLSIYSFLHH